MGLRKLLLILPVCMFLPSCATTDNTSAQYHREAVSDDSVDNISVGKVQREIFIGMSGADVVSVLGAPNIVTSDEQRRETWVYDKISTEQVVSASYGKLLWNGIAGAESTTQKTLTIIIKFDKLRKVRDFAYHTSKF